MTCLNAEADAYLHEEASDERLPDVDVVVATAEVCAGATQVEAVHDAGQLLSHVVCTLHGPVVDEVVIGPLRVVMVCWTTSSVNCHIYYSVIMVCWTTSSVNCHIYYSVIMVCWTTSSVNCHICYSVIMVCWTTSSQSTVTFTILSSWSVGQPAQSTVTFTILSSWSVGLRAHSQLSHLLFCHHGLLAYELTINCHLMIC